MAPDATCTPPARALSQHLFKVKYRLEVSAAVARRAATQSTFTNKEIATELGDPPGKGQVGNELSNLRAAGLVRTAEVAPTDRTKPLIAVPSPYWAACLELSDRADDYLTGADRT